MLWVTVHAQVTEQKRHKVLSTYRRAGITPFFGQPLVIMPPEWGSRKMPILQPIREN